MGSLAWICVAVSALSLVGGTVGSYLAYQRVLRAVSALGSLYRR
jgi:hypothetical protein